MKILFTGGGTGGHVIPIIAIVREIRRIYTKKDLQFFFIGPKDEFSAVLLSHEGIRVKHVPAGKIRRYTNWKSVLQNIFDVMVKIPLGILKSLFYIFFLAPDVIFNKGGFGAIPIVIAGKMFFTPIFSHESDISPGMANRFLSRFSFEVFVSFPKTEYFPLKKMTVIGNPIRRELLDGSKEEGREFFKINSRKPAVLILGGSQGSQRINDRVLEILPEMLKYFEVIHQCGDQNYKNVKAESKVMITPEMEPFYHLFPFLKEPELRLAYAAADFIVNRAGAGSIFEIAAAGKASILIPLPEAAQNHQIKNAYAYAENGASTIIEESNFTAHFFLERMKYFFSHPEEMQKMRRAAKEFARPQAAKILAEYIVEYLTK